MPFMCLTCGDRTVFNTGAAAIEHMTTHPFHQVVYYDDKSIDLALDKVKKEVTEDPS